MRRTLWNRIIVFVLALSFLCAVPALAAEEQSKFDLEFFFSPGIMNDVTGEINLDINLRNVALGLPFYLGDICGVSMEFTFDATKFDLKQTENNAFVQLDSATLIRDIQDVTASCNQGRVSFAFLDGTLQDRLINRDGTLFRMTLVSKSPQALWNSSDRYPLRFVPGSLGVVTYHLPSYSVGRCYDVAGFDGAVGAYNNPPSLRPSAIDKEITFPSGQTGFTVDGVPMESDATPFVQDGIWMIPVRFLLEQCGMQVEWNDDVMTAGAYGEYRTLVLDMANSKTYINARQQELVPLPVEKDGRIYIPADTVKLLFGSDAAIAQTDAAVTVSIP